MIQFRSNIQTAEFGLYQMSKHSAPLRVYKSDMNLLHGFYTASISVYIYISFIAAERASLKRASVAAA